jgi:Flp pilus assembly protein TadG
MTIQPKQRRSNKRLAVAAVEFAVASQVLWVLVVGMCEISRALQVKEILTDASRKACRTAILPGASWNDIANGAAGSEIYDLMATDNGFNWSDVTVTVIVTDPSGNVTTLTSSSGDPNNILENSTWGTTISVKVGIPASKTTWGPGMLFITNQMVESEYVVMMRQGNY